MNAVRSPCQSFSNLVPKQSLRPRSKSFVFCYTKAFAPLRATFPNGRRNLGPEVPLRIRPKEYAIIPLS